MVARRYGVRPSALLGVKAPLASLAVDIAVAYTGEMAEIQERYGDWWWLRIYELLGGKREEVAWL